MTVKEVLAQIDKELAERGESVASLTLVEQLGRAGLTPAAVSTAIAYGVQQGDLRLDENFAVRRAQAESGV